MKGIYILIAIIILFIIIFVKPVKSENLASVANDTFVGCLKQTPDFKHLGCYKDMPTRAIPFQYPVDLRGVNTQFGTDIAIDTAKHLANEVGAKVFSLQYGDLFYGFDKDLALKYGKINDDSCTKNIGINVPWVNDVWTLNE
jgi:hypothetical protein